MKQIIPEKIKICVNNRNMIFPYYDEKYEESIKSWGKGYTKFEPRIMEICNNNIALEICKSADNSNNGGKLSFWTCKFIHPDIAEDLFIGINSSDLLKLIQSYTVEKGVFVPKLKLLFEGKTYKFCSENDDDIIYNEFLKNQYIYTRYDNFKKTSKKTSKLVEGNEYLATELQRFVCLGSYNGYIIDHYHALNHYENMIMYIDNIIYDNFVGADEQITASELIYRATTESHIYSINFKTDNTQKLSGFVLGNKVIMDLCDETVNALFERLIHKYRERPLYHIYEMGGVIKLYGYLCLRYNIKESVKKSLYDDFVDSDKKVMGSSLNDSINNLFIKTYKEAIK